jgi:hypothetical protein
MNKLGLFSPLMHPWCSRILASAKKQLVSKKLPRQSISATDMKTLLSYHLLNRNPNQIDLKTLMHLVVMLLSFLGFLRYSDAVSILVHADLIRFIPSPSGLGDEGMLIFIPRSKTDQSWQGTWVAIGATGGAMCPVYWLKILFERGKYIRSHTDPQVDCGPLLRAVKVAPRGHVDYPGYILAQYTSKHNIIPGISHSTFLGSTRRLLLEAGLHIPFGLHSLRSGGATTADLEGIPSSLICQHGRWKLGRTLEDRYLKTHDVAIKKLFKLTRTIWF